MASNRGVVYLGPGRVEVQDIPYPRFVNPQGKPIEHGVILKVLCTNICGSDQHMVRGRTTAPPGLVLGHEITGEIIEKGKDVEFLEVGDVVTAPFNVACGRCRNCREQQTGVCLNVNASRPGGAYGYVDMGGWVGGQAQYAMIPYADFNLTRYPDKQKALEKLLDLTMLSDILPTGFHGAFSAGVRPGSSVYVAGAGPVGLAAAASARLLGAAVVLIGDMNPARLEHARSVGFVPIDLAKSNKLEELIQQAIGVPEVDASVDAVGFEAHGHGAEVGAEQPAVVLNSLMSVTRASGGIGIPGLYVTEDPGSKDEAARRGSLRLRFGLGWARSHRFYTGQTPVLRYFHGLMQAILNDRIQIAKVVNASVLPLEEAAHGYREFDKGAARKFVLDPHGALRKR
ncbi:MAG: formaldehyde dehydrogenase, glutathione-independent [Myxococcaceae bacterium]|nr:formaldehyde dehydrogenase, glutathione-independent [Myxococcaceae bacterium]